MRSFFLLRSPCSARLAPLSLLHSPCSTLLAPLLFLRSSCSAFFRALSLLCSSCSTLISPLCLLRSPCSALLALLFLLRRPLRVLHTALLSVGRAAGDPADGPLLLHPGLHWLLYPRFVCHYHQQRVFLPPRLPALLVAHRPRRHRPASTTSSSSLTHSSSEHSRPRMTPPRRPLCGCALVLTLEQQGELCRRPLICRE